MIIPRTFIESVPILTPRGWRAAVHTRPAKQIWTQVTHTYHDTEQDVRDYLARIWNDQPHGRYCVQTVLRITDSLQLTGEYAKLPALLVANDVLTLNGMTVSPIAHGLKRAVVAHPLGDCLLALPCAFCGRLPRLRIRDGTLHHRHKDCKLAYQFEPDPLVPLTVQVRLWNRYLRRRNKPTRLLPLSRAHLMILGVLREPTELDAVKRIRKYEVVVIDD
jgi:hypothetical protein